MIYNAKLLVGVPYSTNKLQHVTTKAIDNIISINIPYNIQENIKNREFG